MRAIRQTPPAADGADILFLCNSIARQGTYFRWHNLGRGLVRRGHRVTVWAFDHAARRRGEREERRDGVRYRILAGSGGQSLFSQESHPFAALRGCARTAGNFDAIHVFQPFLTSSLPWLIRGRRLAPVALYDWDDLWEGGLLETPTRAIAAGWMRRVTRWLERSLPRRAHHVTVCSEHLAGLAARRGAATVTVVPNGHWPDEVPDRAAARRGLGLRPDGVYLGFMGRTITGAELDWLAATAAAIRAVRAPCRLAVCGLPADLLAPRLGAAADVVDHLGVLPSERCREFAAALDLGLLPLDDVPLNRARFPIKFAEYLAGGAPVLCSDVGPCAKLGRDWPFVHVAAPGAAGWHAAVTVVLAQLTSSGAPAVDVEAVGRRLGWEEAVARLEPLYHRRVTAAGPAPSAVRHVVTN